VGVLLLAAARTPDGLQVTFAQVTRAPVRILASSHYQFDTWTEVGAVPVGSMDYLFADADLPGGSRVHAAWRGVVGEEHGTLVFVTDPDRVMARIGEAITRHTPDRDPIKLITDPRLMEMWLQGLSQLAAARTAVAIPRVTGPNAPSGESDDGAHHGSGLRVDTDIEHWLGYTDDAKSRLGSTMFHFALGGFPALRSLASAPGPDLAEPTDRIVDERKAGLDGDDANTVNDDIDPSIAASDSADDTMDEDPNSAAAHGTNS
jgi:hypothetical protein